MQKILDFFSSLSEKDKILDEKIITLNKKINDLQEQLDVFRDHFDHLDKGYATMTYIVESHNALLVEMTGIQARSSSPQPTQSSPGGMTKLPSIFKTDKDKKPN